MKKEVLFELKNVSKNFGKKEVLKNISLKIFENRVFGIIGPSGSGKTTLLRILTTFYKPTEGKVYLRWEKQKKLSEEVKYRLGFSAQHGSFYPNLSVEENIEFFAKLYGMSKPVIEKEMHEWLEKLEIKEYRKMKVGDLSKGIQKRVDLICSLIHDPEIIILDEPMEDLDPYLRRKVCSIIEDLKERKKTIIICSHFFAELENVCDDIAILFDGQIIEKGSLDKIEKKYGHKNLEEIFLQFIRNRNKGDKKER
jgi:ABC-2 type transport system ATP-binding protein